MQTQITLPSYAVPAHLAKYFRSRLCGACYICHLVGIFRQVRRVLRDDATMWVNIAGCYAGSHGTGGNPGDKQYTQAGSRSVQTRPSVPVSLKPKDWVPTPWMLGMALQRDGWWLRSPIIWAKGLSFCETYSGSVMPESVRDRPTTSYEYLLLLTKSKTYYYDQNAVREAQVTPMDTKAHQTFGAVGGKTEAVYGHKVSGDKWKPSGSRNLRSVWAINPHPFPDAHFATFPPRLVEPCIKAGTSEHGCCPECGKCWERIVEKGLTAHDGKTESVYPKGTTAHRMSLLRQAARERGQEYQNETRTLGWRPGCSCYDDLYRTQFPKARRARKRQQRDAWSGGWWDRVRKRPGKDDWQIEPCMIADPFSGAGTTVMVALRLGRRAIGIDLSEAYVKMSRKRIIDDCPMLNISGEAI